jgi:hypothetical protein
VFDPQKGEAIWKTADVADGINASVGRREMLQSVATGTESAYLCLVSDSRYSPHGYIIQYDNTMAHAHI